MTKTRDDYSEELESQYRRLERAYSKVKQDFDRKNFSKNAQELLDSAHEFFCICYHLREWVKKDKQIDKTIKDKLPSFEDTSLAPNDPKIGLLLSRDLCNSSKHRGLDENKKPNDANTKTHSTGGVIFKIPLQELADAKQENKRIHLKEEDGIFMGNFIASFRGNGYELAGVVESCMHFWKKFFESNDLLLPRSTPQQN